MPQGYSLSNHAFLFKDKYDDLSRNHYNTATALLMRVKKKYDLSGIKALVSIPLGPDGGFGGMNNGSLPSASGESGDQMEITAKDVFSRARINHKAMKASMSDEGSFVRITQRPVKKTVEGYATGCNILWHGDGNGRICKTATSTGYISGGATAPVIAMSTTDWVARWWTKNQLVNFGNSGDTGVEDGLFKVVSVDTTNKRVTFSRIEGTFDLSSGTNADARYIYFQNMFKDAPNGLESTVMATSGDIYSISYDADTWGSLIYDADGAPPSSSMLNYVFNQQSTRVSEEDMPDFILTSPEVWSILSDIPEYQKRINLSPRDKAMAQYGFGIAGLSYTTPGGKTIPIVQDKHCKLNRIYALNSDMMYMYHLPDHGWVDDDGRVFLREANKLWYEGSYGGYFENVVHPTFQVAIKNVGI